MNRNRLILGIVLSTGIAAFAVTQAAPQSHSTAPSLAAAAGDVTVGQFVQRLAMAKGQTPTDVRTAVESLEAVGVALPDDLDFSKRLTEGDVVEIAWAAGLSVTTSTAQRTFYEQQVRRFFVSFGPELGAAGRDHINDDDCPSPRPFGVFCPFGFGCFTQAPFPGAGVPMAPFFNPFFNPGCGPRFNPFSRARGKAKGGIPGE